MSVSDRRKSRPNRKRRRTYLPAARRRAQILDCARAVFAERGFQRANVAHICAAARIGRGTLYQYFANKKDVLRAVCEDLCARVGRVVAERSKVEDVPGVGKAPLEMVVAFCERQLRELLDAVFADEATLRFLLRDARGHDGTVDEILHRIDGLVLGAVEEDIEAARAAGILRDVDARIAALHIIGGVEKVVLRSLQGEGRADLEKIIRATTDLQLFGLLREGVRR